MPFFAGASGVAFAFKRKNMQQHIFPFVSELDERGNAFSLSRIAESDPSQH
jgi:hypothetical protein